MATAQFRARSCHPAYHTPPIRLFGQCVIFRMYYFRAHVVKRSSTVRGAFVQHSSSLGLARNLSIYQYRVLKVLF